jgi:probable phosphoglycerate mutase
MTDPHKNEKDRPWTYVVAVRHGETDWNVNHRIQGQLPVALNARGQAQAAAAAERLASEAIDAIYSSDLARAMQTAEVIAERHGTSPIPDDRMREWSLGILEGLLCDEAEVKHPEPYRAFRVEDPDYVVPGGESIRQRYARATKAVSEIADRHAGGRVMVVTHGGVLDDLYRRTMGLPLDARRDFEIHNGGVNVIRIAGDVWEMVTWGEIGHLEAIGSLGSW